MLSRAQKTVIRNDVSRSIATICDSWPEAVKAASVRGYPSTNGSNGGGKGGHADPVATIALQPDLASSWLFRARAVLVSILRTSPGHNAMLGAFDPITQRTYLIQASHNLVDLWPRGCMRLFKQVYVLADQATANWPPPPKKGERIHGVVVGERTTEAEVCTSCHRPIGANAADPLARIDGKPYHRNPCYHTIIVRRSRVTTKVSVTTND